MSRFNAIGLSMAKSKYANVEIGAVEGLDNQIAEIGIEHAEMETEQVVLDGVQDICASLEAIADEALASIEDGGLDRRAAGMLEVAVESHMSRIGLSATDAVPSMESFGGSGTRVEATQVSVEAIRDQAKQVWDWIVKKFKEMREKLLKWFKKTFSAAAGIKSRAEKVAKAAVDKKGTKKEDADDEIQIGSAAKALYIGTDGKVDVPGLKAAVDKLKDLGDTIFRGHKSELKVAAGAVEKALTDAAGVPKEDWEGKDAGKFFASGKFMGADQIQFIPSGVANSKDSFLGGRIIEVKQGSGAASDMAGLKTHYDKAGVEYAVKKDSNDKAPEVDTDQTAKALAPDAVKEIAESIVVLAESVIAFESDYFKFQKEMEKADKAAEKLGQKTEKFSMGVAGAAAQKVAKSMYSALQRFNQNPSTQFTSASMASAKAALDVCEKCLSQYE